MTGEHFNDFVIQNEPTQGGGQTSSKMLGLDEGGMTQNSELRGLDGQEGENSGGIGKRHMVIKYNEADRKYYLRDLGDGSGTFVRVDN